MYISYVVLIIYYNFNVYFIFNYNVYKDLVWIVNYYNQYVYNDYELNLLIFILVFIVVIFIFILVINYIV